MSLAISCTPRSLLFVLGSWWSWCEETLSVLAVHRARTWADCIYSAVSRSASWINHRLRLSLLSAGAAKWVMRVFISFYPSLHGAIACDVARGSCCCCSCGRATAVVASRACGNISLRALSSCCCVEQLLPILGIAPCLSRLFCLAAIVGLSLLPNPPANYQPLLYLVSHAGL